MAKGDDPASFWVSVNFLGRSELLVSGRVSWQWMGLGIPPRLQTVEKACPDKKVLGCGDTPLWHIVEVSLDQGLSISMWMPFGIFRCPILWARHILQASVFGSTYLHILAPPQYSQSWRNIEIAKNPQVESTLVCPTKLNHLNPCSIVVICLDFTG